jgi:hypothetical protein
MSSGFNTDVGAGDRTFHVQTEDRGPGRPVIDTAVYQNGRVLLRRSTSYEEFARSPEFSADALRQRVEHQHRTVIEELRTGTLAAELAMAAEQTGQADGIQVQLLNPGSWLSAGRVALDVEILRRADRTPLPGAQVEAVIEGAARDARYAGATDDQGRVQIQFPLPPLGQGDLALVLIARTDAAHDEIRFAMRSRSKTPSASSRPNSQT